MAKPATFFANFPVNKHPSTSEVIRRYRSTYEGCDLVPLVTSSIGDSELIIHFQEAYARLFPNCYNKQGIKSNVPSYTPMNQGTVCAKVYSEGIQPIKVNNCGLIPHEQLVIRFINKYIMLPLSLSLSLSQGISPLLSKTLLDCFLHGNNM